MLNHTPEITHVITNSSLLSSFAATYVVHNDQSDMRYSANRVAGYNMNGSLDMRYAANRTPGFNKNGSRDKRYRANKR